MRAFATLALVGSFALSLVSSAFAAPTTGSLANVDVHHNEVEVLDHRSIEKRCDACDANGSNLIDAIVKLKADVQVNVDALIALKVEDYKQETVEPIIAKIVIAIKACVAVLVQIAANVKVGAGVGVGAVVVQVAVVAQLLASIIISIVTICAHIIVTVGGNVSVCGNALVELGVQIQALLAICFQLVVGLKAVIVILLGPIVAILKICGFVQVGAFIGLAI